MDLGLRGKAAVVAAASRGLGRAIAHELAAEGARVLICARGADALEKARVELASATNAEVFAVVADLSEAEGIAQAAATARERLGHVDILVNNAGGPPAGSFEAHPWATWERA